MALFTAGYEGLSIDAFIERLKSAGVDKVLDVREYPLSRKPGFSKKSFAQCLAGAGIEYEHIAGLGCPKPVRNQYKIDRDWGRYVSGFRAYIQTQPGHVREVIDQAGNQNVCMVCFEADYRFCHRSLIAEAAVDMVPSTEAVHLPFRTETAGDLFQDVA